MRGVAWVKGDVNHDLSRGSLLLWVHVRSRDGYTFGHGMVNDRIDGKQTPHAKQSGRPLAGNSCGRSREDTSNSQDPIGRQLRSTP